ncbi:MAG: alpha/beta fold hydrolase [Luteimonas sp.]
MKPAPILRPPVVLLALCLALFGAVAAAAEPDVGPSSRAEATKIIADMRRIVTDEGVERLEKVSIGGIDQWVSIRGNDRSNPVLLMLHGGPGWVAMPTSWYFQRGWEEYFTVVQWDQRGAGKTYVENDPAAVAPTMTRERMVGDAVEMVAWLRREFDTDKVFVVGHSWGSYLGLELAQRKPHWLHAYIGIGQVTNAPESERRGWAWTLEQARRDGNGEAVAELESLAPYAQGDAPVPLADLMKQRKWLNFYGGMVHNRTGGQAEAAAIPLAPEYSDRDVDQVWTANDFSAEHLLSDVLALDMSQVDELEVPLLLFLGRHDYNVSSSAAAEWFERVQAPSKQLVWFEQSAHEVMIEEPGKTLLSLVQYALPLAGTAEPEIRTDDVTRFYALYDANGGRPSVEQLKSEYLAQGSASLKEFAALRRVTAERIAERIETDPEIYEDARQCLEVLPAVKRRLTASLAKLSQMYPAAEYPPVAIVVGRGRPVGIVNPSGATIGLEALCAADFMNPDPEDRFVYVIAHEYVHTQQVAARNPPEPGDPRATVLRRSLTEGAAEFVAELVSGGVGNGRHAGWTRGREAEIETAFVEDMHGTDLSAWMDNYQPGSDEPYDLGYWVGYRIVKAYYQGADDKRVALARILEMDDPEAFLEESGWQPGMRMRPQEQ